MVSFLLPSTVEYGTIGGGRQNVQDTKLIKDMVTKFQALIFDVTFCPP